MTPKEFVFALLVAVVFLSFVIALLVFLALAITYAIEDFRAKRKQEGKQS